MGFRCAPVRPRRGKRTATGQEAELKPHKIKSTGLLSTPHERVRLHRLHRSALDIQGSETSAEGRAWSGSLVTEYERKRFRVKAYI